MSAVERESDMQRIAREVGFPEDHPWLAGCGCMTCVSQRVRAAAEAGEPPCMPMCVCVDCGNKRCPRATHHDNECTRSNDVGQPGSAYATPTAEEGA